MKAKPMLGAILGITVLLAIAVLFLATPATWKTGWTLFHLTLLTTLTYTCLHVGAAILFLGSLGAYKAKLRHAYVAISAGIVMLAISTLQVAVIATFNWWNTAWVNYGFVMLPFMMGALFAYVGARNLARLISAKTILARGFVVLPVVVVLGLLAILLPHTKQSSSEIGFAVTIAFLSGTGLLYLATSLMTWSVERHIGEHYKNTMGWLAAGLFASFATLAAVVIHTSITTQSQDVGSLVVDLVGLAAGILYLCAGYTFTKASKV